MSILTKDLPSPDGKLGKPNFFTDPQRGRVSVCSPQTFATPFYLARDLLTFCIRVQAIPGQTSSVGWLETRDRILKAYLFWHGPLTTLKCLLIGGYLGPFFSFLPIFQTDSY